MTEIVTCPNCQRQLQIPESFFGQTVQCPDCRHMFQANPPTSAVQATTPSSAPGNEKSAAWDKPGKPAYDDDRDYVRRRPRDDEDDDFDDLRISRGRKHQQPHRASLVLVLGILGICCIGAPVTGLIAWILGATDLREMDAGRMDPEGRGQTQTGKLLGMISVILTVLGAVAYCLLVGMTVVFAPGRRR